MGKPAARVGDMHACPMVTGLTPHVGGPITGPGVPTVLIGGMAAATAGDMCACTGPPDSIALGSTGVYIGGKPAALMGDTCAHGGKITKGLPTVLIGETYAGSGGLGGTPKKVVQSMLGNTPENLRKTVARMLAMKEASSNGTTFIHSGNCPCCHKEH